MAKTERRKSRRATFRLGRLLALALGIVFTVIGALPPAAALLIRAPQVRDWATAETARLLREQLGIQARYRVEIQIWPLEVSLHDVAVEATDGGSSAFEAERISITPRLFTLLAGRLHAGRVTIQGARQRLVFREGKLANLSIKVPEKTSEPRSSVELPFSLLVLRDGALDLDLDGYRIETDSVQLRISNRDGLLDAGLRVSEVRLTQTRLPGASSNEPPEAKSTLKEDMLCGLELRAQATSRHMTIQGLKAEGRLDRHEHAGTRPDCANVGRDPERVSLEVSQADIEMQSESTLKAQVAWRTPLALVSRFSRLPFHGGAIGFNGDISFAEGQRLPVVHGELETGEISYETYLLVGRSRAIVEVEGERVRMPRFVASHSDGEVTLTDVELEPIAAGLPLRIKRVDIKDLTFPGLMRDVDVTRHTIVEWDIATVIDNLRGTLVPLHLDGALSADTKNFEVFDSGFDDPGRAHVIGVKEAKIQADFALRQDSIQFLKSRVTFGGSSLLASVKVGFDNTLDLAVSPESELVLADVSPLVDLPLAGRAKVSARLVGNATKVPLNGALSIKDFVFAGFPLGDITSSELEFQALELRIKNLIGNKGRSPIAVPAGRLDFRRSGEFTAEGHVKSDDLDVRDFFAMWHFDEDPRWDEIAGRGKIDTNVSYHWKGARDVCKSGNLRIAGSVVLEPFDLFGERYDTAQARFDYRWFDIPASYLGMEVELPQFVMKKGAGTIFGSLRMGKDAKISANAVATAVPFAKIQGLGSLGTFAQGTVNARAEVGGTLDALTASVHADLSPLRIGAATFPRGSFEVVLAPTPQPFRAVGTSGCRRHIPPPFDKAEYALDRQAGVFHINGSVLGDQVAFSNLNVTRQRRKVVSGNIDFKGLDLGSLLGGIASPLSENALEGRLTARLSIDEMRLDDMKQARAKLSIAELWARQDTLRVGLTEPSEFALGDRHLSAPGFGLSIATSTGPETVFDARGTLSQVGADPEISVELRLRPTNLSAFRGLFPRAEQIEGQIEGVVAINGRLRAPEYRGGFSLSRGSFRFRDAPVALSELEMKLVLEPGELSITGGKAKVGAGELTFSGSIPVVGTRLGEARALFQARDVGLPLADGIVLVVDSNLRASYAPPTGDERSLPRLVGDVTIKRFDYTRPIKLAADIETLARRGRRTEFESLDLASESVEFDIAISAEQALRINNNLIQASFRLDEAGLKFEGTNQRYGLRGRLSIEPGGTIRFRRSDFEIQHGELRFDDLTKIAPYIDLTAQTDYRRYSTSGGVAEGAEPATTDTTAGEWRITLHAYGDAESPKIDLRSQPELSQDDVFLLLTLGLTRTELDQAQSASLGGSVALEALGTLTGADEVVTEALPVIDDFRFGSAYSARTGRTEPTVIIGKRLTDRIRAYVSSGITESREVRSNVEWRLDNHVSVEGAYDNVNDISSSSLGNLGADVRWRLEFD